MSPKDGLFVRASLIVVLLLVLGSPLLAWAHNELLAPVSSEQLALHPCEGPALQIPTAPSMLDGAPWVPLVFMSSALMAVAALHRLRQWRRVAVGGLVIALGTFAFGTAVHAVHHLSEPQKAAECPVFSASQHITGTLADPGGLHVPLKAVTTAAPGASEAPTFSDCFRPAQPRAPPVPSV